MDLSYGPGLGSVRILIMVREDEPLVNEVDSGSKRNGMPLSTVWGKSELWWIAPSGHGR